MQQLAALINFLGGGIMSRELFKAVQETEKNLQLIHKILERQLEAQFRSIELLDMKSIFLLAITVIVILSCKIALSTSLIIPGSLIVALVLFALTIRVREWECPPKPRALLHEHKDTSYLDTTLQQCSNLIDAYERNEQRLKRKVALFECGFWLFLLGIILRLLSAVT